MKRNTQRGMSTPVVLAFMMGFLVVGSVTLDMSRRTDDFGNRNSERLQAIMLAESGIHDYYDRVRTQMRASGSYPFELTSTDLRSTMSGRDLRAGAYTVRAVDVDVAQQDVGPNNNRRRLTNFIFLVEAVGTSQRGLRATMRATFTASIERDLEARTTVTHTGPQVGSMFFPNGAIVSNSTVSIRTNNGLRTFSPDGRGGHLIANDGIDWDTTNGQKRNNTNPNVMDIQGQYIVHQSAYAFTTSDRGIGNSNGTTNYRSPSMAGVSGWPSNHQANRVLSTQNRVNFANDSEVDTWMSDWNAAMNSNNVTRYSRAIRSSDVPQRAGDQWRIIRTPAVIEGNLDIDAGQVLRLMPTSSNPRDNVIIVRGHVRNAGMLYNLGVKLVIEGKYSDTSSAEYRLDTQGSPFPSIGRVLQNAAMVSTFANSDAIEFDTNSSVTTGLIYAAKGGIRVRGNPEFRGILAAGGGGSRGGVDIRPNGGNSFVVHHTPEAAIPAEYDPTWNRTQIDVNFVEGRITVPFRPSRLSNWTVR